MDEQPGARDREGPEPAVKQLITLARELVGKKGRKHELDALLDAIDGLIGEALRQAAEAERARKQTHASNALD